MENEKRYDIYHAKVVFETPHDESFWFGYYNYSPLDLSGERMLAHRADFDGRMPEETDWVEIGWYELATGQWNHIGKTNAFNWQQGSMLQWRQGKEHEHQVVYNCVNNNKYGAKIVDICSGKETELNWPIYGLTPDGRFSVTLQFERSYWCRAYHYEPIKNEQYNVNVAEDDGIFLLDLDSNTVKRIISIQEIIHTDYREEFEAASHWVEHIIINREGTRFAFYHRFSVPNGFLTRLFTANIDGSDLYCFQEWENIGWSHLGWRSGNQFAAFGYERLKAAKVYDTLTKQAGTLGTLVRKVYRSVIFPFLPKRVHQNIALKTCYELYLDKTGKIQRYAKSLLGNDGHPSFTKDGRYMLSDTYALEDGYRYLYIFDISTEKIHIIGKFYSPFNNCGYRSDLHPRFSPDENFIIVDSAHSGRHGMTVLTINLDDFAV